MKIWTVAREYAGIAEAGGVKNVVCSLSESLVRLGHEVTCFLPFYGSVNTQDFGTFRADEHETSVFSAGENYRITFSGGFLNGVRIVLVGADCFSEKQNCYTYCRDDLELFPWARIGEGYADQHLMNSVFQKAVLAYGEEFLLPGQSPDVIHCHDACVAALPAVIASFRRRAFLKTKFVVTVHNAGPCYHHEFKDMDEAFFYTGLPREVMEKSRNGERVEPYLLALESGAVLTTVSPDYAEELTDSGNINTDGLAPIFAARRTRIIGITNGIDVLRYRPEDTRVSTLPFAFSPASGDFGGKLETRGYFLERIATEGKSGADRNAALPKYGFLEAADGNEIYFSYHGRLVRQKGIFVLLDAIESVLEKNARARFIINGQGEESLRAKCEHFAAAHSGRVVFFYGYDRALSRLFTASADFALLPSEFEPCGTEDFIAQIFGTLPVAHATGGLKKILDGKTGFLYEPNTAQNLSSLILELCGRMEKDRAAIDELRRAAAVHLNENYTWDIVAKKEYEKLFANLLSGT